jgi:hypothetical protein
VPHWSMPDRLQTLIKIADLARFIRQLEKELVRANDTRLVVARLKDARMQLDEALEDLEKLERG